MKLSYVNLIIPSCFCYYIVYFIFRRPVWKNYRFEFPENVIGPIIGRKGSGIAVYRKIPGVRNVYLDPEMILYGECYLKVTADTISTCNRVYEEVKKKIAFVLTHGTSTLFDHTTPNFDAIRLQNFDQAGSEAVLFGQQYKKFLVVSGFVTRDVKHINQPSTDSFEPDVSSNYFYFSAKNLVPFFDRSLSRLKLSDSFKLNLTMKVGKIFFMTDRECEEIDLEKSELINNKHYLNSKRLESYFSPKLNPKTLEMEKLEEKFEKLCFEKAPHVRRDADMIVSFTPRYSSATLENKTIGVNFVHDILFPKISRIPNDWTCCLTGISEAPVDWRASLFLEKNEITEADTLPEGIAKVLDECWNQCNSSEELSQNDSKKNEFPIGTESWKIASVKQVLKTNIWVKEINHDDIDETGTEKLPIKVHVFDYF